MRRIHVINRRTKRIAALAVGLSLIAAACGDDDDDDGGDATTATEEATAPETTVADTTAEVTETAPETTVAETTATETETETATETATETEAAAAAMSVTYTLSDVAVWNDGSPITAADFECTWQAAVNTPESLTTVGYDQIVSVTEGATPQEVVIDFDPPFAAWKTLFSGAPPILKSSEHDDCTDVSADFTGAFTYGAMPYMMTEWTPEQIVFETNPGYTGQYVPKTDRIVIVPAEDGPTLLKSGAVDFIFPQSYTGISEELADPNVDFAAEGGGSYEGLYFQQDDNCVPDGTRSCAFADDVFREAFSKSIDIEGVYQQIYAPFAQGLPLLACGPIAPGPYCDPVFQPQYDLEAAAALLEGAGWTKNAEGFWANAEGAVPEIHWMVNTGNTRRESTQEFLIPQLAAAGFNVIADNCEALPCVFETRLPALSYDLAMYISTVAPDPIYITTSFSCENIPTEENDFQGQNQTGWCNEEASEMLAQADQELDEAARADLVKSAIALMAQDYMMLPTLQFPNVGAYRTDKVAGTQNNLANYWAFKDWWNFEDLDGDGQVVIGAEQYPTPDCPNPVTSCANSSWYVWVAAFPQFPSTYDTTNDQTFEPNEILAGEAVVTTA
jgi:peptide/nickel transport system substrate-binding protein